ncbi:MAG: hypothetical protein D3904_13365 [Candidatus Electrothrix sp. EH2]|nr:hypothetical protein [Candidatus Electrothrix sp. EH2]
MSVLSAGMLFLAGFILTLNHQENNFQHSLKKKTQNLRLNKETVKATVIDKKTKTTKKRVKWKGGMYGIESGTKLCTKKINYITYHFKIQQSDNSWKSFYRVRPVSDQLYNQVNTDDSIQVIYPSNDPSKSQIKGSNLIDYSQIKPKCVR